MKKINLILGIAAIAFMASCGNSTETTPTDSPAAEATTPAETPAAETPAAETPATEAPAEEGTKVEVKDGGAAVSTDKAKVEVSKDGIKADVKK